MKPFKNKKMYARFLVKGGVTTPGYMLQLIKTASELGKEYLHFGSRQDLLLEISRKEINIIRNNLQQLDLKIIFNDIHTQNEQNIVSSYVASEILPSTHWLTSGTYLKILESFDFTPRLKVNIVDPQQTLVPLFYGTLNFIASTREDYWYLYVKNNASNTTDNWPVLVYSNDIPVLVKTIEDKMLNGEFMETRSLFEWVCSTTQLSNINIEKELTYSNGFFPEYEGIYRMQSGNNYWAGFYWRNNRYTTAFLEEVSRLCLRTNISRICLTPWKTFMVKDIKEADLMLWEHLIGKYGINMRHSSFELNWYLPLLSQRALNLKKYIVKMFDQVDVRTYGLTFAIGQSADSRMTSIVIKDKGPFSSPLLSFLNSYDVLVAKDFNPNTQTYETAAANCPKITLTEVLMDLCKKYYFQLNSRVIHTPDKQAEIARTHDKTKKVYQCPACFTIYDETYGDPLAGIPAHTTFSELPETYQCYTCGNLKRGLVETSIMVNS
jgi:rubredoxin